MYMYITSIQSADIYNTIHTYIRLIITYDTPHSGTMIYAVTLRNSSVSRYGKIACG